MSKEHPKGLNKKSRADAAGHEKIAKLAQESLNMTNPSGDADEPPDAKRSPKQKPE